MTTSASTDVLSLSSSTTGSASTTVDSKTSKSIGAIVGGVISGVIGTLALGGIAYALILRRQRLRRQPPSVFMGEKLVRISGPAHYENTSPTAYSQITAMPPEATPFVYVSLTTFLRLNMRLVLQ